MEILDLSLCFIAWIPAVFGGTPLFTNLPYTKSVAETTSNIELMRVRAIDTTGLHTVNDYSIESVTPDPSPNTPFEITSGPGKGNNGNLKITANPGFDVTSTTSYVLHICAADSNVPADTNCENLTINIIQSTFPPVLANVPSTITIDEDQATGTSVFQVFAVDPENDAITYTVGSKNPTNAPFTMTAGGRITTSSVIDYETDPHTYELQISITDGKFTVGPETLTIDIRNVNEQPVIQNLPATASIQEDVTLGYDLYAVHTTDTDGDALTYTMVTSPEEGPFQLVVHNDTSAMVRVIDSPGFNFENINKYVLTFFVLDGQALADPKSYTISITNANEPLTIQNLPATVNIPEDRNDATDIFAVYSQDIDIGDTATYTITSVIPSVDASKFTISSATGVISTPANPGFDYEERTSYTINIKATDSGGLTDTGVLSIVILNANEDPAFAESPLTVSIDEELAIGTVIPVTIAATDPDGDTLTYFLQSNTNSEFFSVTGNQLKIAQRIDFENAFHPRIVSLEIVGRDPGGREATLYILLTVNDVNDNAPIFSQTTYNATLAENSIGGTSVVTVYARDLDSNTFGELKYEIADHIGNLYFAIDEDSGLISVKQPADMEASTSLTFDVDAVGYNGDTGTATVNIIITDVNDNRPSLISEIFEVEIQSDADVGQYVGKLEGTDRDYTQTSADLTYSMSSRSQQFSVESLTGHIITKDKLNENPPEDCRTFILHSAVLDNGDPPLVSNYRPVRDPSTFTSSSSIQTFVTSLQDIMPDTRAKMVFVDGQPIDIFVPTTGSALPKCTVTMLFINSLVQIDIDNLFTYQKSFRMVPELLALLTKDENGSPSSTLIKGVNQGTFPIQTVVAYKACPIPFEEPINWWLDTPEGNATIAILSLIGLALLGTAIGLIVHYGCIKRGLCPTPRWPWHGSQDVPEFTRTARSKTPQEPPQTSRSNRSWPRSRSVTQTTHGEPQGRDDEQYDFRYSRNDGRSLSPMSARSIDIELRTTPPPSYTP